MVYPGENIPVEVPQWAGINDLENQLKEQGVDLAIHVPVRNTKTGELESVEISFVRVIGNLEFLAEVASKELTEWFHSYGGKTPLYGKYAEFFWVYDPNYDKTALSLELRRVERQGPVQN